MNLAQFQEKLRNHPRPVVVDFWATWCMPCRAMNPILEKVSREYEGKVDLWKINTDEETDLAGALGILGIPTLIGYSGGKELFRRTGVQSVEAVNALFRAAERGETVRRLTMNDRLLRAGGGLALIAIGWINNHSILLLVLGGLLIFSAVYDRCPIYQAVSAKVSAWLQKRK